MFGLGVVNKVTDRLEATVAGVQDDFLVVIHPGKADDAHMLHLVEDGDLACSAVNNGGDFVGEEEVELVGGLAVSDEETILDFEGEERDVT